MKTRSLIWILSILLLEKAQNSDQAEKKTVYVGDDVTLSCRSTSLAVKSCFWSFTVPGSAFGVSEPAEKQQSQIRPRYNIRMNYINRECRLIIDDVESLDALIFTCNLYKTKVVSDTQLINRTMYELDVKVRTISDPALIYNDKEVMNGDILQAPKEGKEIKLQCKSGPAVTAAKIEWQFDPEIAINKPTTTEEKNTTSGHITSMSTVKFRLGTPPMNIPKVIVKCISTLQNLKLKSVKVTFELAGSAYNLYIVHNGTVLLRQDDQEVPVRSDDSCSSRVSLECRTGPDPNIKISTMKWTLDPTEGYGAEMAIGPTIVGPGVDPGSVVIRKATEFSLSKVRTPFMLAACEVFQNGVVMGEIRVKFLLKASETCVVGLESSSIAPRPSDSNATDATLPTCVKDSAQDHGTANLLMLATIFYTLYTFSFEDGFLCA